MSRRVVFALIAVVSLLAVTASAAEASTGGVKISKIHYAQSGTKLNTEYIVFKNKTAHRRSIGGWKIISAPSTDQQFYVFPKTKIPAGGTVTLYTGAGTNSAGKRYWNAGGPRWNNDGDKAVLKNASGTTVDTCQYAGGGTTAYC